SHRIPRKKTVTHSIRCSGSSRPTCVLRPNYVSNAVFSRLAVSTLTKVKWQCPPYRPARDTSIMKSEPTGRISRRAALASLPVSALVTSSLSAEETPQVPQPFGFDSPPVLQNPTASGMTVVFAINGLGTGWVEFGKSADRLDQRAFASAHGLKALERRFLSVRIEGLEPGEQVFYRVVAVPIRFHSAYE